MEDLTISVFGYGEEEEQKVKDKRYRELRAAMSVFVYGEEQVKRVNNRRYRESQTTMSMCVRGRESKESKQ